MCGGGTSLVSWDLQDQEYMLNEAKLEYWIPELVFTGAISSDDCEVATYSNDLTLTVGSTSKIKFEKSNRKIEINTGDYLAVGYYTVEVVQYLQIRDYFYTDTFQIRIKDDCINTQIEVTAPIITEYDINEFVEKSVYDSLWEQSKAYCEDVFWPQAFTHASPDPIFDFTDPGDITVYTYELADVGTYTFTFYSIVVGELGATYDEETFSFDFEVTNNCPTSPITTTEFTPPSYSVGDATTTVTWPAWTTAHNYCHDPDYTITQYKGGSPINTYPYIVYDATLDTFTVDTWDVAHAGIYTIEISAAFPNGSSAAAEVEFEIVDPCPTATISTDAVFHQSYTLQDPRETFLTTNFYSSSSATICGDWHYSIDFASMDLAGVADMSSTSTSFSLESYDEALEGVYEVTVTAYQGVYIGNAFEYKFDLTIIDPCAVTLIIEPYLDDLYYRITDDTLEVFLEPFLDTVAICGDFSYDLTYADGTPIDTAIFNFNADTLSFTVDTYAESDWGFYDFKLTGTLPYDYGLDWTFFSVEVECVNKVIASPTPNDNYLYRITFPQLSIGFQPFEQAPACGYDFTYSVWPTNNEPFPNGETFLPLAFFLNQDTLQLQLATSSEVDVGIYNIDIVGTLNDPYASSFNPLSYEIVILNHAPYFQGQMDNETVYVGEELYFPLPEVVNPQGGTYSILVSPEQIGGIIRF
mmetsp:Transcript_23308/g.22915  ORF Transcript_23308/g.22915 Transcript_23308/m.22915 type:complete len:696 (+) Transcript_23308:505-2592(+)